MNVPVGISWSWNNHLNIIFEGWGNHTFLHTGFSGTKRWKDRICCDDCSLIPNTSLQVWQIKGVLLMQAQRFCMACTWQGAAWPKEAPERSAVLLSHLLSAKSLVQKAFLITTHSNYTWSSHFTYNMTQSTPSGTSVYLTVQIDRDLGLSNPGTQATVPTAWRHAGKQRKTRSYMT